MAYFAPVNGDSQPVFALDTQNGPVAPSTSLAGQPVQPQGPKLDFFRLVANTSVNGEGGVTEYVANVLQAIQQTCHKHSLEQLPGLLQCNLDQR